MQQVFAEICVRGIDLLSCTVLFERVRKSGVYQGTGSPRRGRWGDFHQMNGNLSLRVQEASDFSLFCICLGAL